MILRSKSLSRQPGPLPGATTATPAVLVPTWLRRAVPEAQSLAGKEVEDIAATAGAAIGALDAVVRRQERWAGVWRQGSVAKLSSVNRKSGNDPGLTRRR